MLSTGPTSPKPPDPSVHKFLLLLSIPEPRFSLSFALERSLSPSLSWWQTAPCQTVRHTERKSRLCCAVAAVDERTSSSPKRPPPAPPPSAALPHLDAVQRRHPHVQEHPIKHRHRDVLQDSGMGISRAVPWGSVPAKCPLL